MTWGPMGGYDFDQEEQVSRLFLSINGEPHVPNAGLARVAFESTVGTVGSSFDYTFGAYLKIPWVRAGIEYGPRRHELIPAFSGEFALRRGGLLRRGDRLRIDYRPWDRQVLVGYTLNNPFTRYRPARPLKNHVSLPKGDVPKASPDLRDGETPGSLQDVLGQLAHSMEMLDKLLTPRFEPEDDFIKRAAEYRDHIRMPGHTFLEEDSTYHASLARAFTLACGGNEVVGHEMARVAEAILFDDILVPFNRSFGQNKKPPGIGGYARVAAATFDRYLASLPDLQSLPPSAAERQRVLSGEVFRTVLNGVDKAAGQGRKRWRQSHIFWLQQARLVWLPLNYGLQPHQYDTQEKWNVVIARLTGQPITDANTIEYLPNEQFHQRLKKLIRDTESYDVLLIHDFRGRYGKGETDRIGWDLVIDGYLAALTEAIEAMDRGDRLRLPQYIIFLDENYYQANQSREVMTFLENLYDPEVPELRDEELRARVAAAHRKLRDAIAHSTSLKGLSRKDLMELFRVHVNVTNAFDPAFRSDADMRDHRKIAFRDIFEDHPASGAAIFTGEGVGEHYNGPGWEDRSILVRGPALNALKTTVRELFLSQGYSDPEVPPCLRARDLPPDYDEQCAALRQRGWNTPLSVVFNETSFSPSTRSGPASTGREC
jgi:hypothetical protein